MEPTTSGTQYIFSLTGHISAKELNVGGDDDETESTGEESASDDESEMQPIAPEIRADAFPKIAFFGTGSSFPGVTKSVTSILVQIKLVSVCHVS